MLLNFLLLQSAGTALGSQMMLILGMLAVMYFFMMRPQMRAQKEQKEFLKTLTKGDEVVIDGGIIGKIVEIDGEILTISTDGKNTMRVLKGKVSKQLTDAIRTNSASTKA